MAPKKKIGISDISNGSKVNVIGGKRIKGLSATQISALDKSTDDISIQVSRIEGSIVNLVAEDDISFSRSDFQEALSSFENILLAYLNPTQDTEVKEITSNIRTESQRSKPDLWKLKGYFESLLKIVGLLKIDPATFETLKHFVLTILTKIGLS